MKKVFKVFVAASLAVGLGGLGFGGADFGSFGFGEVEFGGVGLGSFGALNAKPSQAITPLDAQARAYFHIDAFAMRSTKTGRIYRIQVAMPKTLHKSSLKAMRQIAPKGGYDAMYMLDGNAFLPIALNLYAKDFARDVDSAGADSANVDSVGVSFGADSSLDSARTLQGAPFIVAIGHDSDLAFDRELRVRDYLPARESGADFEADSASTNNENVNDRNTMYSAYQSGGDKDFLDFIESELKPAIAKRYPINPAKSALFGHSFGGVFVLGAAIGGADFSHFFAISPSMWWNGGASTQADSSTKADSNAWLDSSVRLARMPDLLLIMRGSAEGGDKTSDKSGGKVGNKEDANATSEKSAPDAKTLASILQNNMCASGDKNSEVKTNDKTSGIKSCQIKFIEIEGASHGAMIKEGMQEAFTRFFRADSQLLIFAQGAKSFD